MAKLVWKHKNTGKTGVGEPGLCTGYTVEWAGKMFELPPEHSQPEEAKALPLQVMVEQYVAANMKCSENGIKMAASYRGMVVEHTQELNVTKLDKLAAAITKPKNIGRIYFFFVSEHCLGMANLQSGWYLFDSNEGLLEMDKTADGLASITVTLSFWLGTYGKDWCVARARRRQSK